MCDPVSIAGAVTAASEMAATVATYSSVISVGMSAVQAVAGYEGQRQQASQQADSLRRQYAANDAAMQVQQNQINQQNTQQMSERARQAMIERGHLIAVASESGLGGNSLARAGNALDFAEGTDMATFEANRTNAIAQAQRARQGGYQTTVDSLKAIKQPSLLGAGLQILGAGVDQLKPVSRMPRIGS